MAKSLIGAVAGAILGAIVGCVIAGMNYQFGDTSSTIYAGRGITTVIGAGFGAIAGAIVGSTSAVLDALHRATIGRQSGEFP